MSPGSITTAPGVPVLMMSPGYKRHYVGMESHQVMGRERHVGNYVFAMSLPVLPGTHLQRITSNTSSGVISSGPNKKMCRSSWRA